MIDGGGLAAAFDGNSSQAQLSGTAMGGAPTGFSSFVGVDWGSGVSKTVARVLVTGPNDANMLGSGGGTTFKIQGSNDNSTYADLTGVLNFPAGFAASLDVTSGITITTAYRYHRLAFTGNGTNYLSVAEIALFEATGTNNLTVRSASFTAASTPTSMKALIRVKEVVAAVAGTDYTLECSRDGGTTWAAMTLTELFTSASPTAGIRVVEAAETSVSGQPSGTAPRWRFKTLNSKNVELHDAYLYWS
jgi:hypothetical protein